MKKNILIVGQGIAGSTLAWYLHKDGAGVTIVDQSHHESSSVISVGIINPITGKRFAFSPDFIMLHKAALNFYDDLHRTFGGVFYQPKKLIRFFENQDQVNRWQRKNAEQSAYGVSAKYVSSGSIEGLKKDDLGGLTIEPAGLCSTSDILKQIKQFFYDQGQFINDSFDYNNVEFKDNHLSWGKKEYDHIIFCEGYRTQYNPWFNWLKFNSVKGEILHVELERDLSQDTIYNRGKWLAPIKNHLWAAGSTYHWDDVDCIPTSKAREEILRSLATFIKGDIKVIDHFAAVRPIMEDQLPAVGLHPKRPQLGVFTGLASKGFLVAPYWARQFAQELTKTSQQSIFSLARYQ